MFNLYSHQISSFHTAAFPTLQPSRLCPGRCLQCLLPSARRSIRFSSPGPSLLSGAIPAFHIIWKLKLRQRLCVFVLFFSIVRFLYVFAPQRLSFTGLQVFCSGASTNIRFPSTSGQHMVSAFHPGSQSGQACLISAFHDGSTGPCLLGNYADHIAHASVCTFFILVFKSHDDTTAKF